MAKCRDAGGQFDPAGEVWGGVLIGTPDKGAAIAREKKLLDSACFDLYIAGQLCILVIATRERKGNEMTAANQRTGREMTHIQGADYCLCLPQYGPLAWQGMKEINGRVMHTHIHRFDEQLWKNRMRRLAEVNERIERRLQG